jgi:hypothetical protein
MAWSTARQILGQVVAIVALTTASDLPHSTDEQRRLASWWNNLQVKGLTDEKYLRGKAGAEGLGEGIPGSDEFAEANYPKLKPLSQLLGDWNPNDVREPANYTTSAHFKETIRHFDWNNKDEMAQADEWRRAELPFVVTGHPTVAEVNKIWTPEYLLTNFGSTPRKVEKSPNNRFCYFNLGRGAPAGWVPPQEETHMPFEDWYKHAVADNETEAGPPINQPHYYLQVNSGESASLPWITDDLSIFQKKKSFFILDPDTNRGAHCRLGTKGVIAAAHYDGKRNFIAMLVGKKRYVLLPPTECPKLGLHSRQHPSARHSGVDWSNPDLQKFPTFPTAQAAEVVLRAGEVLYIPSYWFHYIISLETSVQCNSRSGNAKVGRRHLVTCGFYKNR